MVPSGCGNRATIVLDRLVPVPPRTILGVDRQIFLDETRSISLETLVERPDRACRPIHLPTGLAWRNVSSKQSSRSRCRLASCRVVSCRVVPNGKEGDGNAISACSLLDPVLVVHVSSILLLLLVAHTHTHTHTYRSCSSLHLARRTGPNSHCL